ARKVLMPIRPYRRRRSVLYVPALNHKALAKLPTLACDCVVIDLEDSIAPSRKAEARDAVKHFFETRAADGKAMVLRINALSSEWGADDLAIARQCRPDAILLPKAETARDVLHATQLLAVLDARASLWLWVMVETPRAMLNLGAIAALGRDRSARLACLVAGTNDLVKDTGILATPDRRYLVPWLMQMVLAARAGDLDILDGVSNDFRDLDAFGRECSEGRNMGFDGKTLIHPAQIGSANNAFSPAPAEVEDALAIRAAFALPDNADKGVISLEGKMVERLHLDQAER